MPLNHHPSEGVRLLIELQDILEDEVEYQGVVFTPDKKFSYKISIDKVGVVRMASLASASIEDEAKLKKMTESIARKAIQAGGEWPDRILRWRGPGRG